MKTTIAITLVMCLIFGIGEVYSQSTAIIIGGEETELSNEGVISGRGSSLYGGLGAALLDTFNIYYQPLGEGDFQDNLFPDPEVYSFQMNIPAGLPNYQSLGIHGTFWDSRGRNGEGVLPWIREDWREGRYFDAQYNPTGDESPFGLVSDSVQWKIDYWDVNEDDEINFIHTCLSGMVEDFNYNEETGNATALLVTLQTAYLGYGEDGAPGPGAVEYAGGAYQGFDSFRERSGLIDFPAYFFQYDGEANEGSLTPCGTKVSVRGEGGVKGYFDTVQAGIDASEDGDTVLVAPGEYPVNLMIENKNITLASWFLTTGDREFIEQTILDGVARGRVINMTGENNQTLICGLTVRNGFHDRMEGSGIDISDGASPILRALIVSGNQGGNGAIRCEGVQDVVWSDLRIIDNLRGGWCSGLLIIGSVVTIHDALFRGNEAGLAGAIYMSATGDGILTLNRCEFDGNSSRSSGVAEVQRNNTLNLNYCYAHDNTGGMLDWFRANGSVINANYCIFEGRNEERSIAIRGGDAPPLDRQIVNCTFVGFGGYAIWSVEGGIQVNNCILWGNGIQQDGLQVDGDVDVTFSLVENMEAEGILNEDPLFVNPDEGDYHLTENSPCIDTGDPDSPDDPDGTRADMGAFYFHQRDIEVDNGNLTFEPIAWESVDSLMVSISNTGGNDLHLTDFLVPLHLHFFYFNEEIPFEESITIAPNSTYQWWIFFHPQREGQGEASFQASFMIESDDPDEPEIEISLEGSVLSVEEEQMLPNVFALYQCYPNPFNSTTTIEYALPFASQISLTLYNLSGQRVETLVNGRLQAGVHRTRMYVGDLASGLYFVRLETGSLINIQKVMLVK